MENIINKIKSVSNQELDSLDTSYIARYNFMHPNSYFHGQSGREHYRLLMYISTLINRGIIFDVGTYRCMSAAALSFSGKNKVISYDIEQNISTNPDILNVEYKLGDVRNDENLSKSQFIFFDVDHDGKFEKLFLDHLREIEWKGLMLCDDIYLNDPMKKWWDSISEEKIDLTNVGHWSGTGLIIFK